MRAISNITAPPAAPAYVVGSVLDDDEAEASVTDDAATTVTRKAQPFELPLGSNTA